MTRFCPPVDEVRPPSCSSTPASPGEVSPPAIDRPGGRLRPAFESLLATVLLAMALPVLAVAAVLIKLTSHGPVVYHQTRLGRDGRRFTIYKLRTMRHNCEAASGIKWATKGDSRITRIGKLLRATHIDELPQLINVIRGDMSLVGPRPERPEIVATLVQSIPDYPQRLQVRPGVTGLAQVQLPADTDLDSVRRKLALDLVYIGERTLWLDVRLVVGTLLKVGGVSFSGIRVILGLPTAPCNETLLEHPALGATSRASADTVLDHPILTAVPAT